VPDPMARRSRILAHPGQADDRARRVAIHEDIVDRPLGHEMSIGDMGTSLSGGQKHRLLPARVVPATRLAAARKIGAAGQDRDGVDLRLAS